MKKIDFNYILSDALIAQRPLPNRNASRLLCVDRSTGQLLDRHFVDFIDLIDAKDIVVFNDTKVMAARLFGNKASGGKVEVLIERIQDDYRAIAHVKASKTPKPGSLISFEQGFQCEVLGRAGDLFQVRFLGDTSIAQILAQIGHIPLPPYIERQDDGADWERYQTVFAKQAGAVAAPTAGLHFDGAMMDKIAAKGASTAFVTLHVGSGTFQPVRTDDITQHIMHKEYFAVSAVTVQAIQAARSRGGRVIAIGTTAVRALESASVSGQLQAGYGETDLFITPGYVFKSVDALLTNFHLPESTLLMLVSAFAGYQPIKEAYQHAIAQSYRFFSYGDAMFLADF